MTIDLVHKGINKAKGVADMLKHYGIAQKDLIAFGDGENDIGMLEACGYSYAMKNANEKTKAVAKYEARRMMIMGCYRFWLSIWMLNASGK